MISYTDICLLWSDTLGSGCFNQAYWSVLARSRHILPIQKQKILNLQKYYCQYRSDTNRKQFFLIESLFFLLLSAWRKQICVWSVTDKYPRTPYPHRQHYLQSWNSAGSLQPQRRDSSFIYFVFIAPAAVRNLLAAAAVFPIDNMQEIVSGNIQ